MSICVGEELDRVLSSIIEGKALEEVGREKIDIGTSVLPKLAKDNSDRNRTSPFAFTGNKFEFRMPGSSFNIACTNVMLNTAVADALHSFTSELEKAEDFNTALSSLIKRELTQHRRILFNGNGYSREWEEEAERRGLSNYKTTPDAVVHYCDKKNVELFVRNGIYTEKEMRSRMEITLEEYQKVIHIEAAAMSEMLHREVLPACIRYSSRLADDVLMKERIGIEDESVRELCRKTTMLVSELADAVTALDDVSSKTSDDTEEAARYAVDRIVPAMGKAREISDKLETIVDKSFWPMPTYSEILFYV